MQNLKGWRTLGFNFLLVIGPIVVVWASGVDWTHYLNPTWSAVVTGAIGIGLRLVTTTPPGKAPPSAFSP